MRARFYSEAVNALGGTAQNSRSHARTQKNMATKNKKQNSKNSKTAVKTEKATVLALDVKQNHSMRKRLESQGIDAMALHAFDKLSKSYVEQMLARATANKQVTGKSVTLVCNGVTERITLADNGDYTRIVGNGKTLHGNAGMLKLLYGESVETLSDEQVKERFNAQKEIVKRKLGDGREIVGAIIAQGKKGEMTLDVVAVNLGNGKFALHNLEDKTNVHQRKANRWQALQVKEKKSEAKTEAKKEVASK